MTTVPTTGRETFAIRHRLLVPVLVGVVSAGLFLRTYAINPARPGASGRFPLGWWGWWDQSQYLLSARALAHFDFASDQHWYPFGYALLCAPFSVLLPLHGFLLPDLICYLACYLAFLGFARAVTVGPAWAALLFLLGTAGSQAIRDVWAEPWNTTLSSALIWSLLALTARHMTLLPSDDGMAGRRRLLRLLAMGAIAGFVPITRPTDALLVAIWAVGAGSCALRDDLLRRRDLLALLAGALLVLVPGGLLWLRIYGFGPSPYVLSSRDLGFSVAAIGWKSYLLLISPAPWFTFGAGITQRLPWVLPGLAGMLAAPWLTRGRARQLLLLLSAMIVTYSLLFFSYVDLIPSGLWRYNNIHYFKWMLPGMALFAFLLLRELVFGRRRAASLALAAVLVLYVVRWRPHPAAEAEPAWMVQVAGPTPGWDETYFAAFTIRDERGVLVSIKDFRALPDSQGWRLIALRRPFYGSLLIGGLGHPPDGPVPPVWAKAGTRRWSRSFGVRLPCWLSRCVTLSP